ncbi:MAG: Crp/Fnr family transcriptional regulator [Chloroflexi bacterium]|nr:Crp/Fnr family transcriptional regulator [Chloroflexota bacterium]
MSRGSRAVHNDRSPAVPLQADNLVDRVSVLRACPVFSGLQESQLERLAGSVRFRRFKRGSVLFYEDDPWPRVCLIGSGKIKTSRASASGKLQIVSIIGAGELMGLASIFDEKSSRVTAEAIADSDVYIIPRELFKELLLQCPAVAFEVIRVMSGRLDRVHRLLDNVTFERVPQRIARFFLWLAHDHGTQAEDGICLELILSRKELAEAVGTSEETTVRVLTKLRKAGIIRCRDRRIVIVEPRRLQEWAER